MASAGKLTNEKSFRKVDCCSYAALMCVDLSGQVSDEQWSSFLVDYLPHLHFSDASFFPLTVCNVVIFNYSIQLYVSYILLQ